MKRQPRDGGRGEGPLPRDRHLDHGNGLAGSEVKQLNVKGPAAAGAAGGVGRGKITIEVLLLSTGPSLA